MTDHHELMMIFSSYISLMKVFFDVHYEYINSINHDIDYVDLKRHEITVQQDYKMILLSSLIFMTTHFVR